ncbi:MAG: hypothetical protein JSU94_02465 [Phycisphaerales bacterium]|nr:MAG: hypothetical protein JSU94_02465 [Phycisphaerales bacterium]
MKTVHPVSIGLSVILALTLFTAVGCKKKEAANGAPPTTASDKEPTPTDAQVEETAQTGVNLDSTKILPYEVLPAVGMGSIRFGMSRQDVIKEMGEPDKVADAGMSLLYRSKGFSLAVHPNRGVQHFNFYTTRAAPPFTRVKDFRGKTKEGISMGASRSKILAAYGLPDNERVNGPQVTLEYHRLGLTFILLKDELIQFFMAVPPR